MRVARCLSSPRMKTDTTRCGAWSLPPGPGTRPGLIVLKRNAPRASVGIRPNPLKPRSRGFLWVSSGCAYLPWEFACQISTMPSFTPARLPSSSRPWIVTRSPLTCGPAMLRVTSQVSPMWRYGPTVWLRLASSFFIASSLHRRRGASAQHDVEAIGERVRRPSVLEIEGRDQPRARLLVGEAVVHGIEAQQRIPGKVHLRHHAGQEGLAEQREMDVRRAPGVVVVAPRVLARPDRDETVTAQGVRHRTPCAGEIRIEWCIVIVGRMR